MKEVKRYTFYPEWGSGVIDEEIDGDYVQSESYDALLAERDELLGALEGYVQFLPVTSAAEGGAAKYSGLVVAADSIRTAIAKARGDV
jgi:hypothetical protein